MTKLNFVFGLSGVAIAISIVAVCIAAYRSPELGFDYQGVLVGILALLVTVLIGWQIYTFIDINSKKRDLTILSNEASINGQKSMSISENANWMIYHYLLLKKDPLGLEYRFLYHGIACLFHTSQYGDVDSCNLLIKAILETIVKPSEIKILDSNKNRLISLLSRVRNSSAITGYNELLTRVLLIKTIDPNGTPIEK
jgi:hypothetical protein